MIRFSRIPSWASRICNFWSSSGQLRWINRFFRPRCRGAIVKGSMVRWYVSYITSSLSMISCTEMYALSDDEPRSLDKFRVRLSVGSRRLLDMKVVVWSQSKWPSLPGIRKSALRTEKTNSMECRCLSACSGRAVKKASSGGWASTSVKFAPGGKIAKEFLS